MKHRNKQWRRNKQLTYDVFVIFPHKKYWKVCVFCILWIKYYIVMGRQHYWIQLRRLFVGYHSICRNLWFCFMLNLSNSSFTSKIFFSIKNGFHMIIVTRLSLESEKIVSFSRNLILFFRNELSHWPQIQAWRNYLE